MTGVLIQDESKANIVSNTMEANGSAVSSVNAGKTEIKNNLFVNNNFAVILRDASRSQILGNEINSGSGVKISEVSEATVRDNTFTDCEEAIRMMNRAEAFITNNKMSGVKKKIIDERVK